MIYCHKQQQQQIPPKKKHKLLNNWYVIHYLQKSRFWKILSDVVLDLLDDPMVEKKY